MTWISHGCTCVPHPEPHRPPPSPVVHTHNGILLSIEKNAFESVLMRRMKLEPITQSEVSQKEKHQYSILTHIYRSFLFKFKVILELGKTPSSAYEFTLCHKLNLSLVEKALCHHEEREATSFVLMLWFLVQILKLKIQWTPWSYLLCHSGMWYWLCSGKFQFVFFLFLVLFHTHGEEL